MPANRHRLIPRSHGGAVVSGAAARSRPACPTTRPPRGRNWCTSIVPPAVAGGPRDSRRGGIRRLRGKKPMHAFEGGKAKEDVAAECLEAAGGVRAVIV